VYELDGHKKEKLLGQSEKDVKNIIQDVLTKISTLQKLTIIRNRDTSTCDEPLQKYVSYIEKNFRPSSGLLNSPCWIRLAHVVDDNHFEWMWLYSKPRDKEIEKFTVKKNQLNHLPTSLQHCKTFIELKNQLKSEAEHTYCQKFPLEHWKREANITGVYWALIWDPIEDKWMNYVGKMTSLKDRWNPSRKTTTNSHIPAVYHVLNCFTSMVTIDEIINNIKCTKALLVDVALAASIVHWHLRHKMDLDSEEEGAWLFVLTENQHDEAKWVDELQSIYPNGYNQCKPSLGSLKKETDTNTNESQGSTRIKSRRKTQKQEADTNTDKFESSTRDTNDSRVPKK